MLAAAFVLTACTNDAENPVDNAQSPQSTNETFAAAESNDTTNESTTSAVETATEPDPVEPPAPPSRIYVSTTGNDSRGGEDPENAVASIDRAASLIAPGGTIVYQPGTYPPLRIVNVAGERNAPLRIAASGVVEFRDDDYTSGAAILIENSSHLEVIGMQTRRSLWGIYVTNSHHVTLRSNDVGDVGQEGIRIKDASSHIRIDSNTIADTGLRTDQDEANGEGIYLGTGSPGGVDLVSHIVVINNRISRTTDEAIDVKRPATNVDIIGNNISDVVTQTTGAIVVHLNNEDNADPRINIERNIVRNVTRSSPFRDGNCIVSQTTVRIVNNVLHDCQHRGIFLLGGAGEATIFHNTLINTGSEGALVNEGMNLTSENNLGIDGAENRIAEPDTFVDPNGGVYQLNNVTAAEFSNAPSIGISNDLLGVPRSNSGAVTFGAVEG